ncbi:hypothetical protein D3C77_172230 [compost metagenome]
MDNIIDAIQGTVKTLFITYVTDEEAHTGIAFVFLGHVPLLHFIAREDDDFLRIVFGQGHRHEGIAEGTGTAGDEDGLVGKHTASFLDDGLAICRTE